MKDTYCSCNHSTSLSFRHRMLEQDCLLPLKSLWMSIISKTVVYVEYKQLNLDAFASRTYLATTCGRSLLTKETAGSMGCLAQTSCFVHLGIHFCKSLFLPSPPETHSLCWGMLLWWLHLMLSQMLERTGSLARSSLGQGADKLRVTAIIYYQGWKPTESKCRM